jgi:hypothetical protein
MNDRKFIAVLKNIYGELSERVMKHDAEQDRLRKLQAALEELLDIYDPGHSLDSARPRSVIRRAGAGTAQAAIDMLRVAKRPLTTREIAKGILEQRGMPQANPEAVRRAIPSVAIALRRQARKGLVDDGGSFPARWRIADKIAENG